MGAAVRRRMPARTEATSGPRMKRVEVMTLHRFTKFWIGGCAAQVDQRDIHLNHHPFLISAISPPMLTADMSSSGVPVEKFTCGPADPGRGPGEDGAEQTRRPPTDLRLSFWDPRVAEGPLLASEAGLEPTQSGVLDAAPAPVEPGASSLCGPAHGMPHQEVVRVERSNAPDRRLRTCT